MAKYYKIMILVFIVCVLAAGCINTSLPIFKKTNEDGVSVIIDGVRYKQLPELSWDINEVDKMIGYAGDYDISVYDMLGDINRNFVCLHYKLTDYNGPRLYRTDIDIPKVSADSIDKMVWTEYSTKETKTIYTNITEDSETIKELFSLLNTDQKIDRYTPIKNDAICLIIKITLYCSNLPGASYNLEIGMNNGKIICGKPQTGYVYMTDALLEKISGKKVDIEELLVQQEK